MPYSPAGRYDAQALRRSLHQLHVERANQGKPRLDTIFKLSVAGHADPALERDAMELASHGFDEVIIQGIWDAGLEPGIAALPPVRAALDG